VAAAFLMLTACALPGLSGMGSFTTASHPTQEYCASRGMTLDAAIDQCVVPPASKDAEATGSLAPQTKIAGQPLSPPPQQASTQPAPQKPRPQQSEPQLSPAETPQPPSQEKRMSVPIEEGARIKPDSQNAETAIEYAHFVRATGYRCNSISALTQRPMSATLTCDQSALRYSINKDRDGRLIVTVD
jgi:hypothetical protein